MKLADLRKGDTFRFCLEGNEPKISDTYVVTAKQDQPGRQVILHLKEVDSDEVLEITDKTQGQLALVDKVELVS